jgi:hypothetical protein
MADHKSESITVNVKKNIPADDHQAKAERKGGGYLSKEAKLNNATDSDSDDLEAKDQANRQGMVIQPTEEAKEAAAEKSDEETENNPEESDDSMDKSNESDVSKAVTQLNTPVKSDPLPGDRDDVETAPLSIDSEEQANDPEKMTVAAHATKQMEALSDNRDYKINKKQLKKAPQRSSMHIHKTWVFIVLVVIVSLGLAYGYLTVVEGLSFEEITSRLGL